MTTERLETLRFIKKFRTISVDNLALNQRITMNGARQRLRRMRHSGQVKKEGKGAEAMYSLTKLGAAKLAYFEERLEEVDGQVD